MAFSRVTLSPLDKMPPPLPLALLAVTVLLLMNTVDQGRQRCRCPNRAAVPLTVELVTLTSTV